MPNFTYIAKQGPVKRVEGQIEADNVGKALKLVEDLGLTPVHMKEVRRRIPVRGLPVRDRKGVGALKSVKPRQIVRFTRQMSDLTRASVPILRSLSLLEKQFKGTSLERTVGAMRKTVKDGGSLSTALAQHPDIFNPLYINMVRTGELGGMLPEVLHRLAVYLEQDEENLRRIVSSLAYPLLILTVGVVSVFILLSFVVPRITVMFEDLGQQLPLLTRGLILFSGIMARWWWLIVMMVVAGLAALRRWAGTETGRLRLDYFILSLPVVGDYVREIETARVARTLATLLDSGIVVTKAIASLWGNVENYVLKEKVRGIADDVSNGSSLCAAMTRSGYFPDMVIHMVGVGEETGQLSGALMQVAETYEKQSELTARTVISLLGPLALIGIITVMGVIVIAMLLPIFQMSLLVG